MKINVKPLSVNKCWQGRRFKTPEYKAYSEEVSLLLKPVEVPEGRLQVFYRWGVSNMRFDADNACKPFQDILCSYLGINDSLFDRIVMEKVKTAKGEEFIEFEITKYEEEK